MTANIVIPAATVGMTEAVMLRWLKQPGDSVDAGEPVAEIETDKATMELASPAAGVLGPLRVEVGDVLPVGAVIATVSDAVTSKIAAEPTAARPDTVATPMGWKATAPSDAMPASVDGVTDDELREWLATMLTIRVFEDALEPLCRSGDISGGVHMAAGQEAVAVGVIRALRADDVVTSSHRPHHHAVAKGMSPRVLMAELFGAPDGCCGGRGGTMHLADFSIGYFGANGIVGAAPGIAMGASLASLMRGAGQVAVGFTGDGAINTGRIWETVNLAAIWRLPLIIVCENNVFASQTRSAGTTASASIRERVAGFGMRAVEVDGQDVGAVHAAAGEACDRARRGDGPTFIDAQTYRFYGHVSLEVVDYRTAVEREAHRGAGDPIQRLLDAMLQCGAIDLAAVERLVVDAERTVADAISFARQSAERGAAVHA